MKAPSTETGRECTGPLTSELPDDVRPTVAVIDTGALEHNYREVVRRAGGRKILAVVKAQAYGHGAVPVSRQFLRLGADMLGVALVEEGKELRSAGIDAPVLLMGSLFPEQAETVVALRLTPVVYTISVARALSDAARKLKTSVPVHVKIDTGMGRIGIVPADAPGFIKELRRFAGINVQGLMTHFADADLREKQFAAKQMELFELLVRDLEAASWDVPLRHAANSAAVLDFHRAFFTMVRPGLMLYGYNPLERDPAGGGLHPVLSFLTRIVYVKQVSAGVPISYGRTFVTKRESLIATLPVGYADGYSRGLSNRGEVLVRGRRVPVVGRVCMDMTMIDVTDVAGVCEGDEVVLIGSQGSERITASDIAVKTGTIPYEVLCGISSRVPRIYQ
jgi:alanine racemase